MIGCPVSNCVNFAIYFSMRFSCLIREKSFERLFFGVGGDENEGRTFCTMHTWHIKYHKIYRITHYLHSLLKFVETSCSEKYDCGGGMTERLLWGVGCSSKYRDR